MVGGLEGQQLLNYVNPVNKSELAADSMAGKVSYCSHNGGVNMQNRCPRVCAEPAFEVSARLAPPDKCDP